METDTAYYVLKTGSTTLKVENHVFEFIRVDQVGGKWWYVYATNDASQIKVLDKIIGTYGLKRITENDYNLYLKKKKKLRNYNDVMAQKPQEPKYSAPILPKKAAVQVEVVTHRVSIKTPKSDAQIEEEENAKEEVAESSDDKEEQETKRTLKELDNSADLQSTAYATSYANIRSALGISAYQMQRLSKMPNFPAKGPDGYELAAVRKMIST